MVCLLHHEWASFWWLPCLSRKAEAFFFEKTKRGGLAQVVEHMFCKHGVFGSTPKISINFRLEKKILIFSANFWRKNSSKIFLKKEKYLKNFFIGKRCLSEFHWKDLFKKAENKKNRINPTQVGKHILQRLQRLWAKELGKFLAYLRKKQAQNRNFWGHQRKGSNCLSKTQGFATLKKLGIKPDACQVLAHTEERFSAFLWKNQ